MSLRQIDQNLTTLRHIDSTWNLPSLPEQVMLDLAVLPGMNPNGLESLLYGSSGEMEVAGAPTPTTIPALDPQQVDVPAMDPQGVAAGDTGESTNRFLARWFSSIQGGARPHEMIESPLQDWKRRAIQGGYIEMDATEFASGLWRPEYNQINNQMTSDRMMQEFQGAGEGSLSVRETANIFDDWLSPSGLMRAAIDMDLAHDYGQIQSEFMDWPAKARKWWHDIQASFDDPGSISKGASAAASGLDMVTGPIDDVAVPFLNWFLLLSGVGNVFFGVKGLTMGAAAVRGGRVAAGLTAASKVKGPVGWAAKGSQPLARALIPAQRFETGFGGLTGAAGTRLTGFGRPSGLSNYLVGGLGGQYTGNVVGRGAGAVGRGLFGQNVGGQAAYLGGKMQAWRNLRGVQAGKLGFQQLWRTGLAARTTGALTGLNQEGEGGFSLSDVGIVDELRDDYLYPSTMSNIAGDVMFDLMFTPYALYEPGTIKSMIRGAANIKNRALHATGRVIPSVRKHLAAKGAQGSRAIATFHESTLDYLRRHEPELAEQFEQVTKEENAGAALLKHFFDGDEADFGGAYIHALYSIGIEHAAAQAARRVTGVQDLGDLKRNRVYMTVKHQLEVQTRYLEPHNIYGNLSEIAAQKKQYSIKKGGTFGGDRQAVADELARLVDEFLETPASAAARGTKVGDGTVRLIREGDPNSLDYSWYRTLKKGEIPDADAQILDLSLEEYAAFHGRHVDDIKDFFNNPDFKHYIPPAMEGNHRVFDWKDIEAGTARRWDPEKSKWMWDPEIVSKDGTVVKGLVHNHNAKRDATIAEIINNLESGNPGMSPAVQSRIPAMGQMEHIPLRDMGYTPTVPALSAALTDDFLERFRYWNEYLAASEELGDAVNAGGLRAAKYLKALTPQQRRLNMFPFSRDDPDRPRPYAGHLFGEGAGDVSYIEWLNKGMYAPLLRTIDPGVGRPHLARMGTVTKQEAIEFAAQVTWRYGLLDTIRKLRTSGVFGAVDEAVDRLLKTHGSNMNRRTIQTFLDQVIASEKDAGVRLVTKAFSGKQRGKFGRIVESMMSLKTADGGTMSLKNLEEFLVEDLTGWAQSGEWAIRFRLKDLVDAGEDMVEVARKRAKQLVNESKHIAAEIDPESLPPELVSHLAGMGYKAVHGVEFTDPRMLGNLIPELGLNQQHIVSRLTLGLSRQNPYWLSSLRMRTTKATLAASLAEAAARLPKPQAAKFTKVAAGAPSEKVGAASGIGAAYATGDPNSKGVQHIIDKLWKIVRSTNEANQAGLDAVELGIDSGLAHTVSARLRASRTPYSVPDLATLSYKSMRVQIKDLGFTEDEFQAIWHGLKKARKLQQGTSVRGLAHLEDILRSNPNILNASLILGKHRAGDFMREERTLGEMLTNIPGDVKKFATDSDYRGKWSRTYGGRGLAWGGTFAAGGAAVGQGRDPDATGFGGFTPAVGLGLGLPAALMGNAAVKLATRKLLGLTPEASRAARIGESAENLAHLRSKPGWNIPAAATMGAAGAAVGGGLGALGTEGDMESAIKGGAWGAGIGAGIGGFGRSKWWEALPMRNPQALFSHTDWQKYAYMGDFYVNMRDYLRFSLSPIFDMSRFAEAMTLSQVVGGDVAKGLRLNQNPKAFRKALRREYVAQGFDKEAAVTRANTEWLRVRSSFMDQAKGRGDFDWENIENMSRWFTSVGIFGFSPQSWMASTYGQMLRAGVSADDAYSASRSIYTYGMTGRSAAEQSVNMVFFPFSFMKKTLGHFGHYMMQDYSRSVILHDMLKAIELVDEKHNLQERFDAYLPILGKMRRMNLFAYGLSPGEFGGPNAPGLRFLWHSPPGQIAEKTVGGLTQMFGGSEELADDMMTSPIIAALLPQAVRIKDADDMNAIKYNVQRGFPVWNDFRHLAGDIMEQAEVVVSPHHVSKREQNNRAWEEWDAKKAIVKTWLNEQGLPYTALQSDAAAGIKSWLDGEKAKLLNKYPSWGAEMAGGASGGAAINNELRARISDPTEPVDALVKMFYDGLVAAREQVTAHSDFKLGDVDFLPPDFHLWVRDTAAKVVAIDPDFLGIYNRIWAREYGPISREVR